MGTALAIGIRLRRLRNELPLFTRNVEWSRRFMQASLRFVGIGCKAKKGQGLGFRQLLLSGNRLFE